MNEHEKWIRDNGLGWWLDKPEPPFFSTCAATEDNTEPCEVCPHKEKCSEYFKPLTDALERYSSIGEV